MSGYTKKIAVIKQVKSGFSADGGNLSGLVMAETYAGFLKVEASLINFAPLNEGRYVLGISDGLKNVIFDGACYEGECDFNLSCGFAFLVCFCNGACAPIASAACGQMACALPDLKEEMTRRETGKPRQVTGAKTQKSAAYDDEAIAEENYYEYSVDENGGAVRKDKAQEEVGSDGDKDEKVVGAVEVQKERVREKPKERLRQPIKRERVKDKPSGDEMTAADAAPPRLAGGDYYERMRPDVEKIFAAYPKESELEEAMEGSRWAKIDYGEGKYYVFGVLFVEGVARYICYGVPSANPETPPKSLQNCASYMPTKSGGYWIMYQDASTGISVKIDPV